MQTQILQILNNNFKIISQLDEGIQLILQSTIMNTISSHAGHYEYVFFFMTLLKTEVNTGNILAKCSLRHDSPASSYSHTDTNRHIHIALVPITCSMCVRRDFSFLFLNIAYVYGVYKQFIEEV